MMLFAVVVFPFLFVYFFVGLLLFLVNGSFVVVLFAVVAVAVAFAVLLL